VEVAFWMVGWLDGRGWEWEREEVKSSEEEREARGGMA
jgi:hypothetical protein